MHVEANISQMQSHLWFSSLHIARYMHIAIASLNVQIHTNVS